MKFTISLFVTTTITCSAFVAPSAGGRQRRLATSVSGISEWRDLAHDDMSKPIGILPSLSRGVILQGQTKYLQLTEDADIQLFQQALDGHESIIGMGLLMHDGINVLNTMPLLEIEDYNRMGGDFGIFAKVRVVGRARMLEGLRCTEHFDEQDDQDGASDSVEANNMADIIESAIAELSAIERVTGSEVENSRLDRYWTAYQAALESDNQGYVVSSNSRATKQRSWQELASVSWAAYSTSISQEDDATFRLNAMNMQSITERLDLAMRWLSDVRQDVEQEVSKS